MSPASDSVTPSARISPDYIQYGNHGKYVLQVNGNAQFIKADLAAGSQLDQTANARQMILPTTYLHNLGYTSARSAIGTTVTIGISDYLGHQQTLTATVVGIQNASLLADAANINRALRDDLTATQTQGRPATVKTGYASAVVTYSSGHLAAVKRTLEDGRVHRPDGRRSARHLHHRDQRHRRRPRRVRGHRPRRRRLRDRQHPPDERAGTHPRDRAHESDGHARRPDLRPLQPRSHLHRLPRQRNRRRSWRSCSARLAAELSPEASSPDSRDCTSCCSPPPR